MTTTERTRIQNFVNTYSEIENERNKSFKWLQQKSKSVSGHAWCCALSNYEEIVKAVDSGRYVQSLKAQAQNEYDKYVSLGAKKDMMIELMSELAELNFWK